MRKKILNYEINFFLLKMLKNDEKKLNMTNCDMKNLTSVKIRK